jgi:hypothetical protein
MVPYKEEPLPLFPPRTAIPRPSSEATEIWEDEEDHSSCQNHSPMRSVASVSHFGQFNISQTANLAVCHSLELEASPLSRHLTM